MNPADCKHQVQRHNAFDWFSGRQKISWDPDVAELQEDDSVVIHLIFLAVIGTGCHYIACSNNNSRSIVVFRNISHIINTFLQIYNDRLKWRIDTRKNIIVVKRLQNTTELLLPDPDNNYAMAIRVTGATLRYNQ